MVQIMDAFPRSHEWIKIVFGGSSFNDSGTMP